MKTEQLAVVQGWADTRGALRRWNARPAVVLGPWALASLLVGVLLLAATFVTTAIAIPILLLAGAVEVWVSPRLLLALS